MGMRFTSTSTRETFFSKVMVNCKSGDLVYLIECKRCKLQYVGETENPLHKRMNGHRSEHKCKLPEQVAVHYNLVDHSFNDLSVMVIENLWRDDKAFGTFRETYWIFKLNTVVPNGLNLCP